MLESPYFEDFAYGIAILVPNIEEKDVEYMSISHGNFTSLNEMLISITE